MMQEQESTGCVLYIQIRIINLSSELLRNFKINRITYIVIKVIEAMQLTYFVMRSVSDYHWNFSFVAYFSILLNFISLDNIIRTNPAFFAPALFIIAGIMFVMIILGVLVALRAGRGEKVSLLVKIGTPILNLFLYLFKTILAIPVLIVTLIGLVPKITSLQNITPSPSVSFLLGSFLLITFFMLQLYILYIFREPNPFSELPHAGETFFKGLIWLLFKAFIVVMELLDVRGTLQGPLNIIFMLLTTCVIIYSHYEIGMYKKFERLLQIRLLYAVLVFGLLQSMDHYLLSSQVASFCYLLPFIILSYIFSQWMFSRQLKSIAILNVAINDKPQALESHVLYLISLIDTLDQKESRIHLEGYMQYHRRDCRLGEECPCFKLGYVRQRNEQTIKMQYFELIVSLLQHGCKKFANYKQFNLLLAELYHFRIKNPLQAIYALAKTVQKDKFDVLDRLYVSYFSQKLELDLLELEEKQLGRTIDAKKYLDYTNKMVVFEEHIESCTKHHIQFWRLMLDANPEIKRLEDLGTLITRTKDSLKDEFESICQVNSNSVHLLTIYGKFLLQVTNEQSYNVKYLQKAETIMKTVRQSSKIDDMGDKYSENSQTALVVISGNEGEIGTIVHTNNLIKNLLGYKRAELLDRNVSIIMPKIFGDGHNAILSRFISASESTVNGNERTVPALQKDGYMLPVTALTKALPNLSNGIQIVGYLQKLQEKLGEEEDEINTKVNYMLYRADTEQILGITQGCYTDYNINPCLVYGNAYNINNQLRIKNIFGLSFERSEEGKIAAALEVGEVTVCLNTKGLKDEFIISRPNASREDVIMVEEEAEKQGVQVQVSVRNKVSLVYFGIPIKMITIQPKVNPGLLGSKKLEHRLHKKSIEPNRKKQKISLEESARMQTDELKNLKEFKNFISTKSEPTAITAIGAICICLILLLISCILALIYNWTQVTAINQNMMSLYQLTLNTELATPQILTKLEEQIISLSAAGWGSNNFIPVATISSQLALIMQLDKEWELNLLPFKYFFNPNYGQLTYQYNYNSKGVINKQQLLLEEVVTNYISYIDTLAASNLNGLANATSFTSNLYQKYSSAKVTELYSLKAALNASNSQAWGWYSSMVSTRRSIIISLNSLMIAGVILWIVLLLPYILSVTKINNRVLSLFILIPNLQISLLIYSCLNFMNKNLAEATVSNEDLQFYEGQQSAQRNLNQSNPISPNASGLLSPSQHGLTDPYTQSSLIVKRPSDMRRRRVEGIESAMGVEQRFEKVISSKDRNKKGIILKFVAICLAIIAFILFYLLYSLASISSVQNNLSNYFLLGRRPVLMRNTKLLMQEYLLNPLFQPPAFSSIRTLNTNIIQQSYNLEANLLSLSLAASQSVFDSYNNGDVCAAIPKFSDLSIFNQSMNSAECYNLKSGVLQKGIRTGIVSVLEDIRSIISSYPSSAPKAVLVSKALEYNVLVKYLETPMLAILSAVQSDTQSIGQRSSLVIILTGCLFMVLVGISWQLVWRRYLNNLNVKIWRTKGLLNLIPMRIITSNDLLKNEFTSGQLEKAVR